MDPLIIGGIIAGVASLGSAIYSGISSKKAADKANATSTQLMREQNEFNAQMMREQNQYNSYSAQVQRAQEAGLNPSFLFQSGGTSQAAAPATGVAVPEIKQSNFGQSFIDQLYKNTSLLKDIKKNEAEIDKAREETKSLSTANQQLSDRLKAELEQIHSNTSYNDAKKKESEENAKVAYAHTQEIYKNIEQVSENIELMRSTGQLNNARIEQINASIKNETSRTIAEIQKWAHENNQTDAQTRVLKKSLLKISKEIELQIKEGRSMDAAWFSQVLDNAVKSASAEADIRDYELRLEDPQYDMLVRYCSGIIGSIGAVGGAAARGFHDDSPNERAQKRLDNFFQGQASWMNAH